MIALSIVIPTYNRSYAIRRQLIALESLGVFRDQRFEVVVGNNASVDETDRVLRDASSRVGAGLRAIDYSEHVGSAEQNIARLILAAKGDYVWLLSDDDVIFRTTFGYLRELVFSARADCFVFDNAHTSRMSEECVDVKTQTIHVMTQGVLSGRQESGKINYEIFIRRYGLTSYGALISRYVIRTAALVDAIDEYIGAGIIYSHVFALLDRLSSLNVEFVGSPLVWRRESVVLNRFVGLADRGWGEMFYPWTTGLVSLAGRFEMKMGYGCGWLAKVRELRNDGTTYWLLEEIFNQVCRQLSFAAERLSRRQIIRGNGHHAVITYLEACGIHSYHLKELSVLFMEIAVQIKRRELYGDAAVNREAVAHIIASARALMALPRELKMSVTRPRGLVYRMTQAGDNYLLSLKRDRPRVYWRLQGMIVRVLRSMRVYDRLIRSKNL